MASSLLLTLFLNCVIFVISSTEIVKVNDEFINNFEFVFDEPFPAAGTNFEREVDNKEEVTPDICQQLLFGRADYFNCTDLVSESEPKIVQNFDKCGVINNLGINPRLSGSEDAKLFEFPWLVVIYYNATVTSKDNDNGAGSLIHPKIVLTVAHRTLDPASALIVRAGAISFDTSNPNILHQYQDRNIEKIIIHENFNKFTLYNDIALLILEQPFELSPYIRTICLPPLNANFDDNNCVVAAWTSENENKFEDGIQKLNLPIVSNQQCQNALRRKIGRNNFNLHISLICAGGNSNEDASNGDGGAPLMCPIDNTTEYYLVGLVAGGIARNKMGVPGIYTNVPHLRSWIDEKVLGEKHDTKYYTY